MLPVTLQIPAAIFLVLGGAVACFAGYRFFRIVLGLYGFVLGALLATTVAGAGSTSSLVMWAVVGGVAGALVLNLAYFFGVVLVGAALGAMAVTLFWSRASGDPHVLIVVAAAVVGALAAMWLQRYVVVTGTAFGGAWTLLVGVLALMGDAILNGRTWRSSMPAVVAADGSTGKPAACSARATQTLQFSETWNVPGDA